MDCDAYEFSVQTGPTSSNFSEIHFETYLVNRISALWVFCLFFLLFISVVPASEEQRNLQERIKGR